MMIKSSQLLHSAWDELWLSESFRRIKNDFKYNIENKISIFVHLKCFCYFDRYFCDIFHVDLWKRQWLEGATSRGIESEESEQKSKVVNDKNALYFLSARNILSAISRCDHMRKSWKGWDIKFSIEGRRKWWKITGAGRVLAMIYTDRARL